VYRVFESLDALVTVVEEARGVPMTSNCVVPRGDVLELLDDIREALPGELDDAQDVLDRREELKDNHGIGYCNITKCCTKVCPEHITITDNAIIPLKERVVDRSYDPLRKLVRLIRGKRADGGMRDSGMRDGDVGGGIG